MNRQRFVDRDFQNEGSPRSQELAAALAVQSDPEFLEAVLHAKGALDEFGGQVFVAATRQKVSVDEEGVIRADESGAFATLGYIVHYSSKASIRRLQTEEETSAVAAPDEPDAEQEFTGEEPETGEPTENGQPVGATEET